MEQSNELEKTEIGKFNLIRLFKDACKSNRCNFSEDESGVQCAFGGANYTEDKTFSHFDYLVRIEKREDEKFYVLLNLYNQVTESYEIGVKEYRTLIQVYAQQNGSQSKKIYKSLMRYL